MKRRTQEERRQETLGRLIEATIEILAEEGYARTSVARICKRAGVSQGALFNYFDTRLALIAAATEHIATRHNAVFAGAAAAAANFEGDVYRAVIDFARQASRGSDHAAWHEVLVVARTDSELRELIEEPLGRFEQAVIDTAMTLFDLPLEARAEVAVSVLSLLHMFDSESVTVRIYPHPEIEAGRLEWAVRILREDVTRIRERLANG